MTLTSDLVFVLLIICTVYSKHVFTIDTLDSSVSKKESALDEPTTLSNKIGITENENEAINKHIRKPPDTKTEKFETKSDNRMSEFVQEGGGIPQQTSATFTNNDHVEPELIREESHPKGSKGRKGVDQPGSSVFARKGVDEQTLPLNNSLSESLPLAAIIASSTISSNKIPTVNATEVKQNSTIQTTSTTIEEVTQKITHAKKPEVVSDLGDADDFDKYTMIKTSTTGEDYVIIGIVIVIGIWFSVFGALIFYRRAGEYWDRRHYRRMDFLVEGMYND